MPDRDTDTIDLSLTLTLREAEMLTVGACEQFHRMCELDSNEIYGALVISKNVLAAREVWRKLEEHTKINEWLVPEPRG